MDLLIGAIMDDLRSCVCAALEDTLGGSVSCACTLVPGTLAPADWCSCNGRGQDCGMAWVRLDRVYPSSASFPSPDSRPGSCAPMLAAVLEVGVYRCAPVGSPPPVAAQTQAALVQADDALAIARGILCCDSVTKRAHLLGTYTPRDGGDCGGGAWTITVQLTR